MNNLAIIPARGGSKRIPRKNVKKFLGIPIIAYSIKLALESQLFKEVMVSTDDLEIAEIALKFGATVPFMRSEMNSNDFATTYDVIEEVISNYSVNDMFFDNICCIYSCAPLITKSSLIEAYQLLLTQDFNSVFPIVQYSTPIQRALTYKENRVFISNEKFERTRSQDLEPNYFDAGQFYWLKIKVLENEKRIYTNNSGAIILSDILAQDIDNETDWKLAELKYKFINNKI